MDSTNSGSFPFRCLLHPRLFCFVTNAADTCKYATNETQAFCAVDYDVERLVLRLVKTKTVQIKSYFFPGKKVFKS